MKSLSWIFRSVFWCHHGDMTRVFTIKERTYQVCLDCGQEFEYSWSRMHSMGPSDIPYVSLGIVFPVETPVMLALPPSPHSFTANMSYLAQTRQAVPVILQSPECVAEAALADSRFSLGRGLDPDRVIQAATSSLQLFASAHMPRHWQTRLDPKALEHEIRATLLSDESVSPRNKEGQRHASNSTP
jgi:hypothetical protein